MTTAHDPQLQPDHLARTFFTIVMIAAFVFYGVVVVLTKVLPSGDADEQPVHAVTVP
jgi:F0F1-type ATP synthase membrane subunit c/vacuolar-type H+-ATPase subunit K